MVGALLYAVAVLVSVGMGLNILMFGVITLAFFGYYIVSRSAWELAEFTLISLIFLSVLNISSLRGADDVRFGYSRILIEAVVVAVIMYKRYIGAAALVRLQPLLFCFALWTLVSSPLAIQPARSAVYATWFLISIAFIGTLILSAPSMRHLALAVARATFFGFGMMLLPSLIVLLRNPGVLAGRFFAPFGMRHVPAMGACLCLVSLIYLKDELRWRDPVRLSLIALFSLLAVLTAVASLNRVAWLGVIIVALAWMFGRRMNVARGIVLSGLAVIMVLGAEGTIVDRAVARMPRAAQQRWEQTAQSSEAMMEGQWEHTDERIFIWRDKVRYAIEHPIAGGGIVNSTSATTGKVPIERMRQQSAHNTFIGVLVDSGFVGAAIFAAFLLVAVPRGIRLMHRGPEGRFIAFLLLASVSISMFEYNLTPGQFAFWPLFVTLMLAGLPPQWYAPARPARPPSASRLGPPPLLPTPA